MNTQGFLLGDFCSRLLFKSNKKFCLKSKYISHKFHLWASDGRSCYRRLLVIWTTGQNNILHLSVEFFLIIPPMWEMSVFVDCLQQWWLVLVENSAVIEENVLLRTKDYLKHHILWPVSNYILSAVQILLHVSFLSLQEWSFACTNLCFPCTYGW